MVSARRPLTAVEKQEIWDMLVATVARNIELDKLYERTAIADFEAMVSQNIALGAPDRETAIRWLVDSLDLGKTAQDAGYVCYELGLPYSMAPLFAR